MQVWRNYTNDYPEYGQKIQPRVCVKLNSYTIDMSKSFKPRSKRIHSIPEYILVTRLQIIQYVLTMLYFDT